jgi:hypothetical protein
MKQLASVRNTQATRFRRLHHWFLEVDRNLLDDVAGDAPVAAVDQTGGRYANSRVAFGVVDRSGHRGDTESWGDKTPPCLGWTRWA